MAFPLAAQPNSELGGPFQVVTLSNGARALWQAQPELPVVAVTLLHPWGTADDPAHRPGLVEELSRAMGRTSLSQPGGALLVRLNRIGGRSSLRCGRHWTSWTLTVPRAHAAWALQAQLERMVGPALKGEDLEGQALRYDRVELELFARQRWNAAGCRLALVGGLDEADLQARLARAALPEAPAPAEAPAPDPLAGGPGVLFNPPASPEQWAQAAVWKVRHQLSLDRADQGLLARSELPPGWTSLPPTPAELRQARLAWLQEWDDISSRSRLLALELAQNALGQASLVERCLRRPPAGWDSAWVGAGMRLNEEPPAAPPRRAGTARTRPPRPGKLRLAEPAPAPPFQRWEYAPQCTALVQPVSELPVVALRLSIPGGAAYDNAAEAGRAEALGRAWQAALEPARVETQVRQWSVSVYLAEDEVEAWLDRFFTLWKQPLAPIPAPDPAPVRGDLDKAYHQWLGLLFPADHPLGREPAEVGPEALQRLWDQVRACGRWQLFASGDISLARIEAAVRQAAPALPDGSSPPGDNLPVQPDLPAQPVAVSAQDDCSLLLGGYGPARRDADYYAFVLLLERLAGDPLSSELALELRQKKNLARRLECNFLSASQVWLVRIDCAPTDLPEVEQICRQQLAELRRRPPSPQQLLDAVERLEGLQQLAAANSSGRVQQLRNLELFRLSDGYAQGFAGLYRGIKPAEVLQSARQRLAENRLVWVKVSPP